LAGISAKDVKALRDETGAGMMDCKNALKEADGDVTKATELLRERVLSKAGKREGRETSEGAVGISCQGGFGVIVELGCETDFVSKNDQFQSLVQSIADAITAAGGAADVASALAIPMGKGSIDDAIKHSGGVVGENIQLKRVGSISVDGVANGYIHGTGGLGVLVGITTTSAEAASSVARDLAMHVAASDPTPLAVDRDSLDPAVVEKERQFLTKQALDSGKPENIVENMVNGRINKFFASICLLEQPFVKDPDQKVGDVVKALGDANVSEFIRYKLGEAAE